MQFGIVYMEFVAYVVFFVLENYREIIRTHICCRCQWRPNGDNCYARERVQCRRRTIDDEGESTSSENKTLCTSLQCNYCLSEWMMCAIIQHLMWTIQSWRNGDGKCAKLSASIATVHGEVKHTNNMPQSLHMNHKPRMSTSKANLRWFKLRRFIWEYVVEYVYNV